MNQGILGSSRARGGSPARPMASRAEAISGTDASLVMSPLSANLSRRGGGRAWFWELFSDFAMTISGYNTGTDGCVWQPGTSGAGSQINIASTGFTPQSFQGVSLSGVVSLETGTTTTGRAGMDSSLSVTTFRFDGGTTVFETLIYLPALADTTDDYVFRTGWVQVNQIPTETVCFEYNRSNSTNWVGVTAFFGSYARVDTGVPVTAGKWILLRVVFTHQLATFFVNGAAVGVLSTLIPAAGNARLGTHIIKTAGTTNRAVLMDYKYYRHDFTNERTFT